ncbi:hypothetical protein [Pararhizobium sp. LjRoot238]|uniref:hypothetical protein n=1 Tax=Pararhizobium sp. LjRoot238 TaxID=3342293 RepID=UPI003ECF32CA
MFGLLCLLKPIDARPDNVIAVAEKIRSQPIPWLLVRPKRQNGLRISIDKIHVVADEHDGFSRLTLFGNDRFEAFGMVVDRWATDKRRLRHVSGEHWICQNPVTPGSLERNFPAIESNSL